MIEVNSHTGIPNPHNPNERKQKEAKVLRDRWEEILKERRERQFIERKLKNGQIIRL